MRILIIEDEIIIARYIERQLMADFKCQTAIALNEDELKRSMPSFLPHLILCDINLKEHKDGIILISELRKEYAFEVIFITSYQSKAIIERALQNMPLHYIIKPVDEAALYAGVKLSLPLIAKNNNLGKRITNASILEQFSVTERKVIQLVLQQKTTRAIAAEMFLSPFTIKNHRHNICRKLGLKNENNALLQWAMQQTDSLRFQEQLQQNSL